MIRRKRFVAVGILALSLNFVPLVASGQDAGPLVDSGQDLVKHNPKFKQTRLLNKADFAQYQKWKKEQEDEAKAKPLAVATPKSTAKPKKPAGESAADKTKRIAAEEAAKAAKTAESDKWAAMEAELLAKVDAKLGESSTKAEAKPAEAKQEPAPALNLYTKPKGPLTDKTVDELKSNVLFLDFNIAEFGKGTDNHIVALRGSIPLKCRDFINVEKNLSCTDTNGKQSVAFRISDTADGKGAACMKEFRDSKAKCSTETCTYLSKENGYGDLAKMKLTGDVTATFMTVDPNANEDKGIKCDHFDPGNIIAHESAATRTEASQRAKESKRDLVKEQDKYNITHCFKSFDDIAIGRDSANRLTEWTEAAKARALKSFDEAELRLLQKLAATKPLEELDEVRGLLNEWASAHEDGCDKIAQVYRTIAVRYSRYKPKRSRYGDEEALFDGPTGGYDEASAVIAEAQELSCLKDSTQDTLANYQRQIELGKAQAVGAMGFQNNMLLGPTMQSLLGGIQDDLQESCSGPFASAESCSSAYSAMQSAARIIPDAQQVDMQRYQRMVQLQQMMSGGGQQQGLGYGYNGMPGFNSGFNPGFSGGSGFNGGFANVGGFYGSGGFAR